MFDSDSRYDSLETVTLSVGEGDGSTRLLAYKRRRFLPKTAGQTTAAQYAVKEGDRLDNLTAAYLGDPTQFWQLCDANRVLHPEELTGEVGRILTIALAGL